MKTLPDLFMRFIGAAGAALLLATSAAALPGAHGPNGEHLDGPAQAGAASLAPRLEAHSELFELVAIVSGGELSILVDRYDTNEPVLNARLEVEAGPLKAAATFHADHGDYAVTEPALLKALAQPGEHALVFTVIAGEHSDLLDGILKVNAAASDHDHDHGLSLKTIAAGAAGAAIAAGVLFWVIRRRRATRYLSGGAA